MSQERSGSQASRGGRSEEILLEAFAKLDRTAFAIAVGALIGLLVLVGTIFAVSSDPSTEGLPLELLAQYYPGYSVTFHGAVLGLLYGFVSGFVLGWFIAFIRNASLGCYLRLAKKKAELSRLGDVLDRN